MHKRIIKQYFEITIGVIFVCIAFHFFLNPASLVGGGVSGIATLFDKTLGVNPSTVLFIGNIFCLIIGLFFLGKDFFLKTIYATLLLPLVIFVLEKIHIPHDFFFFLGSFSGSEIAPITGLSKIVISVVLGSGVTALGLGICFRNNATTGGIDVIQKLFAKAFHFPYSKAVYLTDGIIVLLASLFLGVELGFYSIVTVFLTGQILDLVSMGGKSRRTAFIISKFAPEIKQAIFDRLERGVTETQVTGGYSNQGYTMIICTLSKNESYILRDMIHAIDPAAFTFYASTKEVVGDGF